MGRKKSGKPRWGLRFEIGKLPRDGRTRRPRADGQAHRTRKFRRRQKDRRHGAPSEIRDQTTHHPITGRLRFQREPRHGPMTGGHIRHLDRTRPSPFHRIRTHLAGQHIHSKYQKPGKKHGDILHGLIVAPNQTFCKGKKVGVPFPVRGRLTTPSTKSDNASSSRGGEIGRRVRLKISSRLGGVGVQVPPPANLIFIPLRSRRVDLNGRSRRPDGRKRAHRVGPAVIAPAWRVRGGGRKAANPEGKSPLRQI